MTEDNFKSHENISFLFLLVNKLWLKNNSSAVKTKVNFLGTDYLCQWPIVKGKVGLILFQLSSSKSIIPSENILYVKTSVALIMYFYDY